MISFHLEGVVIILARMYTFSPSHLLCYSMDTRSWKSGCSYPCVFNRDELFALVVEDLLASTSLKKRNNSTCGRYKKVSSFGYWIIRLNLKVLTSGCSCFDDDGVILQLFTVEGLCLTRHSSLSVTFFPRLCGKVDGRSHMFSRQENPECVSSDIWNMVTIISDR